MRARSLLVVGLLLAGGCSKQAGGGGRAPSSSSPARPEFDQHWSSLAAAGTQAFYIEDDRGEGLMGNVLRAQAGALEVAPALAQSYKSGGAGAAALPEAPDAEEVHRLMVQYLPGVKSCYLRISRDGDGRSGKAIVSFQIAGNGRVQGLEVAAPAFDGTPLSSCISGQVGRWAFPPSRKGLAAVSYPFVFVGG
jgi:hypothetical protein